MTEPEESWETRARAAEATASVLATKVMALYAGQGAAAIQKQLARAQERQRDAQQRRALMEVRTQELARHGEKLELEVAARTQELRTILDHVTSGFLLLDSDLRVQHGYTRSCPALFDTDELVGSALTDLLRIEDRRLAERFQAASEQLFEDVMPEELSLDLLSGRYAVAGRMLQVDARAVRIEGVVRSVLLTINDATALEEAQRRAQTNQILIGILRQRDAFVGFLEETRELLAACREALHDAEDDFMRRALHTVKGNAAAFELVEVAALVHAMEGRPSIHAHDIDAVEAALRQFLLGHQRVLGLEYGGDGVASFEISEANVDQLREIARSEGGSAQVERWTAQVVLKRARQLVGPMETYVAKLAERLGKRVVFELVGTSTLLDARTMRPVFHNLTHLLRNAVDHGIELEDDRGDKSPLGRVRVSIGETDTEWCIQVDDDGRGIDPAIVLETAVAKGFVTEQAAREMSPAAALQLIFADGFSTMPAATDVSGRGIGMAAAREAVEVRGGGIEVFSTTGQGTRITMRIPKPTGLRRAPDDARAA